MRNPDLTINTWYTADTFLTIQEGFPDPCGTIPEGAKEPTFHGPVALSVAVERRQPDESYERWCEL